MGTKQSGALKLRKLRIRRKLLEKILDPTKAALQLNTMLIVVNKYLKTVIKMQYAHNISQNYNKNYVSWQEKKFEITKVQLKFKRSEVYDKEKYCWFYLHFTYPLLLKSGKLHLKNRLNPVDLPQVYVSKNMGEGPAVNMSKHSSPTMLLQKVMQKPALQGVYRPLGLRQVKCTINCPRNSNSLLASHPNDLHSWSPHLLCDYLKSFLNILCEQLFLTWTGWIGPVCSTWAVSAMLLTLENEVSSTKQISTSKCIM